MKQKQSGFRTRLLGKRVRFLGSLDVETGHERSRLGKIVSAYFGRTRRWPGDQAYYTIQFKDGRLQDCTIEEFVIEKE